jgi:hypothetical protein
LQSKFIAVGGLPMEQDNYTAAHPVALAQELPDEIDSAADARHTPLLKSPELWMRIAVLTLLVNSTLFFRGCSFEAVRLTTGFPMPAVEFSRGDDGLEFVAMKDAPILIDLAVSIIGGLLIAVVFRRLFFSHQVAAGLLITFAAFNLVLVAPELWAKTVFQPQIYLLDALFENERRIWVMDIISRSYFVLHIAVVSGVMALAQRGWRKYISTSTERWWQFGLKGIFALTTIACLLTILALILFTKR